MPDVNPRDTPAAAHACATPAQGDKARDISHCTKCDTDDAPLTYHASWRQCNSVQFGYQSSMGEHLHYHCLCCGYGWIGPCAGQTEVPHA